MIHSSFLRSSLQAIAELLLNLLPNGSTVFNTHITRRYVSKRDLRSLSSSVPQKELQHGFDAFERLVNPEGHPERWTQNWKDWDVLVRNF